MTRRAGPLVRRLDGVFPLRGRWLRYCGIVFGLLLAYYAAIQLAFAAGWIVEDPLYRAERETKDVLQRYERTRDDEEVLSWIIRYHGEATGHQVMMTLAAWSLEHPDEFVALTGRLPPDQQESFVERFSAAVGDSSSYERFLRVFRGRRSPVLDAIMPPAR
jgi:hypothetical protein